MSYKQINESFNRLFESFEKEGGPFWYYTKHGFGPGMLPSGVEIVDIYEDENYNTWVALNKVLDSQELYDYDLVEEKPPVCFDESLEDWYDDMPRTCAESLKESIPEGKHVIQISADVYVENDYNERDLMQSVYEVLTRNDYEVYGVDITESWNNRDYNRITGTNLTDSNKHVIQLSFDIEVDDEYYEKAIVECLEQELQLDVLGFDVTASWKDDYNYYHNIQESFKCV